MPACGLWTSPRGLVAVLVDAGGRPRPPVFVARTDAARWGLAQHLAAAGAELVVTDALARSDTVADAALRGGVVVWTVPAALAEAIRRASALASPRASATALARMPAIPYLRAQLRRLAPPADTRQLRLL